MWSLELKRIEQLVICGICYEYMKTCVMTPCSHNYCSLCIRKYLHYKTQCPICFEETFEKDLRVNKALDELVLCISGIKDNISKCPITEEVEITGKKEPDLNVVNSSPSTRLQTAENIKSFFLNEENCNDIKSSAADTKVATPSAQKCPEKSISSPSTSAQPKIHSIFTPKNRKAQQTVQSNNTGNNKTVTCPVCKVDISETNINRHLDDCLKRADGKMCLPKPESKRKTLPKLVFSLMKDAELRRKVKEMKLSSQGDRKTLEARLQRYITLYNAECDKFSPRPISDLIRQCEEEEALEKKVQKSSSTVNKLQITRNTEQNLIEEAQKKYLVANKDSFASLIAQAKSTATPKKSAVRRSIFEESPRKMRAISADDSKTANSEIVGCRRLNSYDNSDPDSDSDMICPLQIYSSEDPRRFLGIEMTDSTSNEAARKESGSSTKKSYPSVIDTTPTSPSLYSPSPRQNLISVKKDIFASFDHCTPTKHSSISDKQESPRFPPSISNHSPGSKSNSLRLASISLDNKRTCNTPVRYNPTSSSVDVVPPLYKNPSTAQDEDANSCNSELLEPDMTGENLSPVFVNQSNSKKMNARRGKTVFQKKAKLSLNKIVEHSDSTDTCMSGAKLEDLQEQRGMYDTHLRDAILKDFLDNSSSNDSFNSNYEGIASKNHDIQNVVPADDLPDYAKLEKENMKTITENNGVSRAVRKRIRERSVNCEEKSPKRERRTRRVLNPSSDQQTDTINGEASVLSNDRDKRTRRKMMPEEAALSASEAARMSMRTRSKNANTLKSSNGEVP